ncbi:MAG: LysM peptidoglycan-binding domain-containing protein [Pirellulales bacterium]|nr:LysM peptidoglycan-binding domain-containing protein [Pirellulales bacterium]
MLVLCCGFGTALFFRKDTPPMRETAQLKDNTRPTSGDSAPSGGHLVLRHPSADTPCYAIEGWPTPRSHFAASRDTQHESAESDLPPTLRNRSRLFDQAPMEYSKSLESIIPPSLPSRFPRGAPVQYGPRPVFGSIFFQQDPDSSAATNSKASPTVHRVRDGDTLSKLAERYLGDADRADEIYEWNRDRIENPELLPIGIDLRLPNLNPVPE